MRFSSVEIALIAVFAALQAILSLFPLTLTIGVSGQITLGVIGGPLIGVLLGPAVGGAAVLLGSLIGVFANPAGAVFGVWTVLPPLMGAVGAGLVRSGKSYLCGALFLVSILSFYTNPVGREVLIYPWLHVVAMVVAFSPIGLKAGAWFRSTDARKQATGVAVSIFLGVLLDHIVGSAIAVWYYPMLTAPIWYAIVLVYPVERLVAFTIATVIAVPINSSLRRAKLLETL